MTDNKPAGENAPRTAATHASRPGRSHSGAALPRVRISSAGGVLAVVPHLLGFHPSHSLVVIGVDGPRGRVTFTCRYDLPEPPDASQSADIADHVIAVLSRQHLTSVIVVGYGTGRLVTPVTDRLCAALRRAGIRPRDVLRVADGRYWSYLCRDPRCCPPEGVAYDALSDPAAVALSDAGLTPHPDRAALAGTLARTGRRRVDGRGD